jgi:hypothetical protein
VDYLRSWLPGDGPEGQPSEGASVDPEAPVEPTFSYVVPARATTER